MCLRFKLNRFFFSEMDSLGMALAFVRGSGQLPPLALLLAQIDVF